VQGTCQIHDLKGNFVAQVGIHFTEREFSPVVIIVAIDWYNGLEGYSDPNAPSLALAFQFGKIQV
jgi:WD repeat-containing protein 35